MHGVLRGAVKVQILGDGAQYEGLFGVAQRLMAGVIGQGDQGIAAGLVQQDAADFCVPSISADAPVALSTMDTDPFGLRMSLTK